MKRKVPGVRAGRPEPRATAISECARTRSSAANGRRHDPSSEGSRPTAESGSSRRRRDPSIEGDLPLVSGGPAAHPLAITRGGTTVNRVGAFGRAALRSAATPLRFSLRRGEGSRRRCPLPERAHGRCTTGTVRARDGPGRAIGRARCGRQAVGGGLRPALRRISRRQGREPSGVPPPRQLGGLSDRSRPSPWLSRGAG